MDIGKQQRVIIVEVDETVAAEPAPEPAVEPGGAPEQVVAWPLPLYLDPDPEPAGT
jgi:hypothetical protein